MAVGIAYVDGPRLARSLLAAADWVAADREAINRINVFPVPDGDTGTNFSLTLRAVADALRALGDAPLPDTARAMARAAVLGARGNSGIMLAHFLLGFADALGETTRADARALAAAMREGANRLYGALDDPREGTILTVAREAADAAEAAAPDTAELGDLLRYTVAAATASLARTPELMAALKEAGVVDAGGQAFVRMLEGVLRGVEHADAIPPPPPLEPAGLTMPAATAEVAAERDFRYCTELIVRGDRLPVGSEVRAAMHEFGGSVVAAVTGDILKIHVHTDTPEAVFSYAARWGRVEATKADDMRAQHRRLGHDGRRVVSIVTDSSSDLADTELEHHRIRVVPLQVMFGDRTFRDRIELKPEEFYRRLRTARDLPTTSQPAPAEFVRVLRDARADADEVVAVLLSSGLSGTLASAQAAVRAGGVSPVHVVDSRSASLGVGMLALRGAELAAEGWTGAEIARELERVRGQSGMLLTVDRYDNLVRGGRVSRGAAWLGGMLDVKPVLSLNAEGRVVPVARVRGREQLIPRILALLGQRLTPRPAAVRFGVAHAEAPEAAERVRQALVTTYRPKDCLVTLATGVLGTHVGPGAWAVFYQVEDGAPVHRAAAAAAASGESSPPAGSAR